MGAQEEALKLFLTEDKQEALKIAKNLVKFNQERQNTEKQIFEDVIQEIEKIMTKRKMHSTCKGKLASWNNRNCFI